MSYGLLLLAAALACVSARYTVPVPIHYEIEAQFQKQTGTKMRWDPTNYLTYLAAVYAQCSLVYSSNSLIARGRVANATAYEKLQQVFDPSLLQNNLAVFTWDVATDANQDAGTVDRDLRKLFGKANGQGPLSSIANVDTTLRSYDRFGCSIDTGCMPYYQNKAINVLTFVCVFGITAAPRQVSGTGTQPQPTTPPRTAAPTRPPTTRTRATVRPVTTAARLAAAGITETYGAMGSGLYDLVINELPNADVKVNEFTPIGDTVAAEQKITSVGLCKYETNTEGFNSDVLRAAGFSSDVQAIFYGADTDASLTTQDLLYPALQQNAETALRNSLGTKLSPEVSNQPTSLACSYALCSQKLLIGCAAWGTPAYDETNEE